MMRACLAAIQGSKGVNTGNGTGERVGGGVRGYAPDTFWVYSIVNVNI